MLRNIKLLLRPFSLFHLGTVIVFLGIAISSTYKYQQDAELYPGDSVTIRHLRFHYLNKTTEEDSEKAVITAEIDVYDGERLISRLRPQKHFYGEDTSSQVTTEIGLHTSLKEDIYVILQGWNEEQRTSFTFIISPLILWVWIGGFVVFTLGMAAVVKRL